MIEEEHKIRLDKWLWAARFYKTRNLAGEAIKGGKVHVNDVRVKPSKTVNIGQKVRLRKDNVEITVIIDGLAEKRGSAPMAQLLYTETEESITKREIACSQRKAIMAGQSYPSKRPNKKQRRSIIRFKQEQEP